MAEDTTPLDTAPPESPAPVLTGADDTLDVNAAVAYIAESLRLVPPVEEPPDEPQESPEPPELPLAAAGEKPADKVPAATGAEPAAVAEPAPDTWTPKAREKWAAIDAEVRQEIRKREADIARFVGESKPAFGIAQGFTKVIEPYSEMFQRFGVDPFKHTAHLLQAHAMMMFGTPEQKVGMFKQLAQDAGLDIGAVAQGNVAGAQNPLLGTVHQLHQRIADLERGVTGVAGTLQEA